MMLKLTVVLAVMASALGFNLQMKSGEEAMLSLFRKSRQTFTIQLSWEIDLIKYCMNRFKESLFESHILLFLFFHVSNAFIQQSCMCWSRRYVRMW